MKFIELFDGTLVNAEAISYIKESSLLQVDEDTKIVITNIHFIGSSEVVATSESLNTLKEMLFSNED